MSTRYATSQRSAGRAPSSRGEYKRAVAIQDEAGKADADYRRLRGAYLELVRKEPTNDVALAMVGADMERAQARLQSLAGLPRSPFTLEPGPLVRREPATVSGD